MEGFSIRNTKKISHLIPLYVVGGIFMNSELHQAQNFLKQHGMELGKNKKIARSLLKQLNKKNIIARSMRCVYQLDNFIIKASSDATGFKLPMGADQCLTEFNLYSSEETNHKKFKEILCPVYAIYESKFLYLTVHKRLNPIDTKADSDETIYNYIKRGKNFSNEDTFFPALENFKELLVNESSECQNEYTKINSFGYDENNNLYVLDYGIL